MFFFSSFLTVTKYCSTMYSIHSLPAARAAFTPLGLSSNTMHFLGSIAGGSNLFAQTRLMSGKGLPWMTSGSECPVTMWWKSWNNSWWFLVFNSKYSLELLVAKAIGTWHWCRCLISLSTPLSNFAWKQKYYFRNKSFMLVELTQWNASKFVWPICILRYTKKFLFPFLISC